MSDNRVEEEIQKRIAYYAISNKRSQKEETKYVSGRRQDRQRFFTANSSGPEKSAFDCTCDPAEDETKSTTKKQEPKPENINDILRSMTAADHNRNDFAGMACCKLGVALGHEFVRQAEEIYLSQHIL